VKFIVLRINAIAFGGEAAGGKNGKNEYKLACGGLIQRQSGKN